MKKIFKIVAIAITIVIIFGVYKFHTIRYSPKTYFDNPRIIALCRASASADIEKIDRLLEEGVNINFVGKNNFTPLSWLFYTHKQKHSDKVKEGFKYLLEKGADPLMGRGERLWPVLHATARYEESDYLKMILEDGVDDVDVEMEGVHNKTALLQAAATGRFENFKILLDYGADIEWSNTLEYTPLLDVTNWNFRYELLQRGANFTINTKGSKNEFNIVSRLEGLRFRPSVPLDYRDADYRQKCVQFLREKGVEVNPYMPEDEKYITENGEDILYINENDKWVKYTDSELRKEQQKKKRSIKYKINNWIYNKFSD